MKKYNPNIHHRRSIRLKGYDYAQAGLYFITICCQDRAHRFGKIENGEMILNDAGTMVKKWYNELENKFPDIRCHENVVMPNHFHCIIENVGIPVGADLRVCPNKSEPVNTVSEKPDNTVSEKPVNTVSEQPVNTVSEQPVNTVSEKTVNAGSEKTDNTVSEKPVNTGSENIEGEHAGSPLHYVVQWFKTMTTNEYIRGVKTLGWQPFNRKLWQRNYYEHIIRNEKSYQTISEYIKNNPAKWTNDKFYTE